MKVVIVVVVVFLKVLTCVLLMLAKSISSSMFALTWLPFSAAFMPGSEEDVGSKTWRRFSFSARPSCQLALAHEPTTSSLMLSKCSLRWIMPRTQ